MKTQKGENNIKIEKNNNKLIKSAEIAEILINYAEQIIDYATELQYLLVERYGIERGDNNSKQTNILQQDLSLLSIQGSAKERTQELPKKVDSSLPVQKMYVPVFRLSAPNESATAKNQRTTAQRNEQ